MASGPSTEAERPTAPTALTRSLTGYLRGRYRQRRSTHYGVARHVSRNWQIMSPESCSNHPRAGRPGCNPLTSMNLVIFYPASLS